MSPRAKDAPKVRLPAAGRMPHVTRMKSAPRRPPPSRVFHALRRARRSDADRGDPTRQRIDAGRASSSSAA